MSNLAFFVGAYLFALPAVALIILVTCIYHDIQSKREMKRFEAAVHNCKSVQGWEFTSRLLDRCSKGHLPVINRIELLEHFAGIKNIHVSIAERSRNT
jgi:hypothetical protein